MKGDPGHVFLNPPWGQRLGSRGELALLHSEIGDVLKQRFGGWTAHLLSGEPQLLRQVGLKTSRRHVLFAGPIECRLARYELRAPKTRTDDAQRKPGWRKARPESDDFANRLRKNHKKLHKWATREGWTCYRVYDGDIPEYAVSIDRYEDVAVVYEHARSSRIEETVLDDRLRDVSLLVPEILGVEKVHVRAKARATGGAQYEKRASTGARFPVTESGATFLVNLDDYLDTGLFLDHRLLRAAMAETCTEGTRFLNLFAYTCTASVLAAKKGALTTSVDLSSTYLSWGEENFRANRLNMTGQQFVRTDVERFLERGEGRYDRIFMAPPSYSRSKAMDGDLDLQRDHPDLIAKAMKRLEKNGTLWFSTHARYFELDARLSNRFEVEDISSSTVPLDFERSPHRTWRFTQK
jgi:23S rRNA (guanine2445-N2)-methyltransferase / 23S rRNA (guanine2069-N7)-methyltransferase